MPVGIYAHKPHTEETRKKISKSLIGNTRGFKKGKSPWNKGKKLSEAHKNALRKKHIISEEGRKNIGKNVGKGENHWAYIKDRTQLKRVSDSGLRRSSAYVTWRKEIYTRDGFSCVVNNNECYGKIEAHHIESFTNNEELRYDINNGITLCKFHHPRKRSEEKLLEDYFRELIK